MIVVPLTVPRTRTFAPFLTDVLVDAFVRVTTCPVGVVRVKLDSDTLRTVRVVPPAAGPEGALDPPPWKAGLNEVGAVAAVAEGEPLLPALCGRRDKSPL